MTAQREAFEAHPMISSRYMKRDSAGEYVSSYMYDAWLLWQAAQAAMPSRAAALEEAALLVESRSDLPAEAAVNARVKAAVDAGDEDAELRARRHWLDVSTHNAVLRRAAAGIRTLAATIDAEISRNTKAKL